MPDVPGALVYQNVLYLIKNGGILTTLNPEDGSVLWQGRLRDALDSYYASPVAGDGKVYLASEKGLVTVLRAGAQPAPSATADFGEPIYATPALLEGRIYLRTESKLYCFGDKGI
jgi:outer membrane protein assembly factor BamB